MNQDFLDILRALTAAEAKYLLVGAYAVAVHAEPRATGDIDLWVQPTRANASRVMAALKAFGAPLSDLTVKDLTIAGVIFQMGLPPRRIDILTAIDGIRFPEAWKSRKTIEVEGMQIPVIGLKSLIKNKQAAGRTKDTLDLELLNKHHS